MHTFKKGDRVERFQGGEWDGMRVGDTGVVTDDDGAVTVRVDRTGKESTGSAYYSLRPIIAEAIILVRTGFKVGDRVRKVRGVYSGLRPEGTVKHVNMKGHLFVLLDRPDPDLGEVSGDDASCYELISEAVAPSSETELERLVREANVGYKAIDALEAYADKVEMKSVGYDYKMFSQCGGFKSPECIGRHIRIKPTPAFAPFQIADGLYEVRLNGGRLHVGCKNVPADEALRALRFICKQHGQEGTIAGHKITLTRDSLRCMGHSLSWEDADKILAALEKAGVK